MSLRLAEIHSGCFGDILLALRHAATITVDATRLVMLNVPFTGAVSVLLKMLYIMAKM